ncbi:MarR family transcriptional regulator [Salinibacterium sp. SYSU T00001]|uniref:MarR family winged helix-turn-helix transcriptional regulator n=1 Tax=Homoserinimonas sedimenticola TaxID=2986805 RepID=UPI0022354975|nr:MarR family transcriptional regulator [Salinibacterium sedimenticola]MCW4385623.1 MarR family transcriptional regulator [Salinibacterium sedimenticola]
MQAGEGTRIEVHESTRLLREFTQLSDDFQAHLGRELTVNSTDLQAMQYLIQRGPMSPTALARALDISTAATTVVVDRLVKVGHVTREAHPTDRRAVVVVPAPQSIASAMAALTPMVRSIDRVIQSFSEEERDTITEYLRRVVDVYRESIPEDVRVARGTR